MIKNHFFKKIEKIKFLKKIIRFEFLGKIQKNRISEEIVRVLFKNSDFLTLITFLNTVSNDQKHHSIYLFDKSKDLNVQQRILFEQVHAKTNNFSKIIQTFFESSTLSIDVELSPGFSIFSEYVFVHMSAKQTELWNR